MSKILNIKHVFFDLDHTIWDFDKNSAMAFDSIFIKNRIDIETSKFLEEYIPINFQYWKYFREGQITKEQLRYSRLKKSFDNLNIEIDDHLINKLADDYIAFLPDNNHLFEGKIDHFFKSVTTSESVGVKKPDPKIFRYALEIAEATHVESVMIGDTYEADILGARGVGMQTICFNYHKANLHNDERVVNTLPEILNYL